VKVLVCGGRHYRDRLAVRRVLDAALRSGPVSIIQGGARGTDKLAREWAIDRGVDCVTFHADWETHGPAAGPIRNAQMLSDGKPNLVLAFPGGRGTADMIKRAHAASVLVVKYPPSPGQRMPFDLE
jgi:hypothetical protein